MQRMAQFCTKSLTTWRRTIRSLYLRRSTIVSKLDECRDKPERVYKYILGGNIIPCALRSIFLQIDAALEYYLHIQKFWANKRRPWIVVVASRCGTHIHVQIISMVIGLALGLFVLYNLFPHLIAELRGCAYYWQRLTSSLYHSYVSYPAVVDVCGLSKGVNAVLE